MKNFFSKYVFPVITAINTFSAVSLIITLFGPTATPLTAFFAVIMSFVAVTGWFTISYEYAMAKFDKERQERNSNIHSISKKA